MQRPIEDAPHTPNAGVLGTPDDGELGVEDAEFDIVDDAVEDDLSVIAQEGDVAVIRDLQPERVAPAETEPETEAPQVDLAALRAPDGATQMRYRMLVAGHIASDIACLTLVHQEHLPDLLAGYGGADTDAIRAWWSFRSLTAIRWLVEHGFDPDPTAGEQNPWPRSELDVLRHAAR